MPEPTDLVAVMRVHLEEIAVALDHSKGHFQALDLADGYRQAKPTLRPSRGTAMMERSFDRVVGYLNTEQETPDGIPHS